MSFKFRKGHGFKSHPVHHSQVTDTQIEQSTVNINDDFPFPIKAVIYKPTALHQNTPLQFTIDLIDYSNTRDFFNDFSQQTFSNQDEASNGFEDEVLLNENFVAENSSAGYIDSDELDATIRPEENNSNSTDTNYLDAINLEELFEMFLKEHFGDDSEDQIINFTVFLDFLNQTNSTIIDNQNATEP